MAYNITDKEMKILAIIPARYASTRLPGKPLAKILDKPMIQWAYENVSKVFDHIYVATDDTRIFDTVSGFGGNCVHTSPNHRSGTDRCVEALEQIEKDLKVNFDVVINIQGDEPFVNPEQLKMLAESFKDEMVEISTLIKPIADNSDVFNPNKPKVTIDSKGKALYFSRSPIPYIIGVKEVSWAQSHHFYKHIGIYAYRANILKEITQLQQSSLEIAESLEQLRWLENGYHVQTLITEHETLAVDTPEDLQRINEWAKDYIK